MRSQRGLTRGVVALTIGGAYALIVLASAIYLVVLLNQPGGDPLDGLVLIIPTLPTSLLLGSVIDSDDIVFNVLLFTAGGLFQAWLLWLVIRGRKRATAMAKSG
ncbi:SCO4225 family membrane protein [Acrocarpospora macrocephala]|uniref:SCO4225 family membrane protein n=1 Tax=Acrocarpospora macrocephala TaxID=150177 RepID=UPI0035A22EFD